MLVVPADEEILIQSNAFDLQGMQIHFQPAASGRYTYFISGNTYDGTASTTLTLRDDDSYELLFENFEFPFGKKTYDRCYVNSNGNITFGSPDTDPPNADTLSSSPRIAGFFTDLDPESIGTVFVNQTKEKITITWLRVPEFFNQNMFDYGENTFQVVLHSDGGIDLVYTTEMTATQAFVGIVSGNALLHFIDFSDSPVPGRSLRSFIENFHDYESIDIPALMKSIYAGVSDSYDFVTLLSNFDLTPVPGAQAFAINVRNYIRGIGNPGNHRHPVFEDNDEYGSRKHLQNITFLGNIHNYPSNIVDLLPDTDTSILSILAHEVGHRWLAYVRYPHNGKETKILLGRDNSHWSFFLNSRGSFLEGNDISQENSRSFLTFTPFKRYSDLDLYLMGLIAPDEVRNTFYVKDADHFDPDFTFTDNSDPEADVSFNGSPITIQISEIIRANGLREPGVAHSQKQFQHLFVLITKTDNPATAEEIDYVDLLRRMWEDFFSEATGKRAVIDTNIQ